MMDSASRIVISLVAVGEEPERLCRRLSAAVNQSPFHVVSVVSTGTQIYPVRMDAVGGRPVLLECELRPRDGRTQVTSTALDDILARLRRFEVRQAVLVGGDGATRIGPVAVGVVD